MALALAMIVSACGAAPPRAWRDEGAFTRLASTLTGEWQTLDGTRASYALVSRDTALIETWTSARGARTLTVFHPDGATMLLTHYCGQGNQARLRLTHASHARFEFEREDATNLAPDQSVLTRLVLTLEDGALVRTETYVGVATQVSDETVLRFERAPAE